MTEEIIEPLTAIICGTNQGLKNVLRAGARQAGLKATMILDKTNEAVSELQKQPNAWLFIDHDLPPEDLARILTAAKGLSSLETRPIYLLAQNFHAATVTLALEFNVAKIRFGDLNAEGIEKDLVELFAQVSERAPITEAIAKIRPLLLAKKHPEATASFSKLLKKYPSNVNIKTEYIDFLLVKDDLLTAKSALEDLQLIEPNDIRVQHLLARYYMRIKNFSEAIRLLESLDKLNPWSPDRLIELGSALLETSQFISSRDRFTRALAIDPNNMAAKTGKAQSVLLAGNIQEGINLLKDLGSPRQMAATLNAAAVFASRTDRLDDARQLYERGIQLLIDDATSGSRLWYNLGILEWRANVLERSMNCFRKAVAIDPKFADAMHNYKTLKRLTGLGVVENPQEQRSNKRTEKQPLTPKIASTSILPIESTLIRCEVALDEHAEAKNLDSEPGNLTKTPVKA